MHIIKQNKKKVADFLTAKIAFAKKGYSLVEMMTVIAVLSVLIGVSLVGVDKYQVRKRTVQAIADLTAVRSALENYYAKNGKYPSSEYGGSIWHGYCYGGNTAGPGYGVDWIPELKVSYFPNGMPIEYFSKIAGTCVDDSSQYIYYSNGIDYKLIYINPESMGVPANMIDPSRTTFAWGYWTEGAKGM